MTKSELARYVAEACRLEGEFTLRSGATSNVYFDKYLFESDPDLLQNIALNCENLIPGNIEILAGLELGGVPIATALSLFNRIPVVFVRKEPKSYGTAKLVEGMEIADRRVMVVEDVITTGGQVAKSVLALRHLGADVRDVLCVIDRRDVTKTSGPRVFDDLGLNLISLFTMQELGWHSAVQ